MSKLPRPPHPAAVQAPMPARLAPQLVTVAPSPPTDPSAWIFEIKYDGFRLLARVQGTSVRLITRNGHDWTANLEPLRRAVARMLLPDGWYDGEIVVLDEKGLPNFGLLQRSIQSRRAEDITYYLFDCPYLAGYDLRAVPLDARREILEQVLPRLPQATVRYSAPLAGDPAAMLQTACDIGLEGIVAKRRDAAYVSRRARSWLKLKCSTIDEFLIGGFTRSRAGVARLLLGTPVEDGKLRYVGSVSTGLTDLQRRQLLEAFDHIPVPASPFNGPTSRDRWATWVKPVIRARVSFSEWTRASTLRHPSLRWFGLSEQKPD